MVVGARVYHKSRGNGTVVATNEDSGVKVTVVRFDMGGVHRCEISAEMQPRYLPRCSRDNLASTWRLIPRPRGRYEPRSINKLTLLVEGGKSSTWSAAPDQLVEDDPIGRVSFSGGVNISAQDGDRVSE